MSPPVIETAGLTKRYGAVAAVAGLDLSIARGEVFGLLGPNGSGKTTTILMLLGLTEPTSGSVRVLGLDPFRDPLGVKRRVGYMPDAVGFYDNLTARQNLAYTARLMGLESTVAGERIAAAMKRVRLADVVDRRVGTFSRGMRQRLGLAEILMKRAELAILDEPTAGLDPQSTQELLALIGELRTEGMTVVLSSHLLSLVQSICDRVAMFHRGHVGLVGRVADLAGQVLGGSHVVTVECEGVDLAAVLAGLEGVLSVRPAPGGASLVDTDRDVRAEIARSVVAAGGALKSLSIAQSSLDEVYIRYFEGVANAA